MTQGNELLADYPEQWVYVLSGPSLFLMGAVVSCMMPMMGMMDMDDRNDQSMMDQGHIKEMMQQMMSGMVRPGITPQDRPELGSRGAKLLSTYYARCHNFRTRG